MHDALWALCEEEPLAFAGEKATAEAAESEGRMPPDPARPTYEAEAELRDRKGRGREGLVATSATSAPAAVTSEVEEEEKEEEEKEDGRSAPPGRRETVGDYLLSVVPPLSVDALRLASAGFANTMAAGLSQVGSLTPSKHLDVF